jgi:uncharacterized RDD family membrane protein YckC
METTADAPIELKTKEVVQTSPGGFWRRTGAIIIDGIIISLVQLPITFLNGLFMAANTIKPGQQPDAAQIMANLIPTIIATVISMAITFAYAGYFLSKKGATPGKMVLGLKVVNVETGKNLSFIKAGFRDSIGKFISSIIFGIGYFMVAFRSDKKSLHDIMFSSQVFKVKS